MRIFPLALLRPVTARLGGFCRSSGAVPLSVYLLHVYLIHALSIVAHVPSGRPTDGWFDFLRKALLDPGGGCPRSISPISVTFAAWGATLRLIYPCCRRRGR